MPDPVRIFIALSPLRVEAVVSPPDEKAVDGEAELRVLVNNQNCALILAIDDEGERKDHREKGVHEQGLDL